MGAFVGSWPSSLSEISLDAATRDVAGFGGTDVQFKQFTRRIATDAPEGRIQPGSSFYYFRPFQADQGLWVFSGPYPDMATAKTAGKKACDDLITNNAQGQLQSQPLPRDHAHSMQQYQQHQQQQQQPVAQQAEQQQYRAAQQHQCQHQHHPTQQMQRGRSLERSSHGRNDTTPPRVGSQPMAGQLGLSPKGGVGKQTQTRSSSSSPHSADRQHISTMVTRARSGLANMSSAASAGLSMQPAAPQHPPPAAAYTADGSDVEDMGSEGPNMAAAGQPGPSSTATGRYSTALQPQHHVASASGAQMYTAHPPQHQPAQQQQVLPAPTAGASARLRTCSSAPDMQRAGSSQRMPPRLGVSLQQRQLSHGIPTAGADDAPSLQQQEHYQQQQQQQQPTESDTLTAAQLLLQQHQHQQQQQLSGMDLQQGQQLHMLQAALLGLGGGATASGPAITAAAQQLLQQQLQGASPQQQQLQQSMAAGISPMLGGLLIQLGQQLQKQTSSGAMFNTAAAPAAFATAGGSGSAPEAQLFGHTGQQLLQPVPGGVQQQAADVTAAGDGASAGASAGVVGQQQQQAGMQWSRGALLNAAGAAAEVRAAAAELPPHSLPHLTAAIPHATHQQQQQPQPAGPAGIAAPNPFLLAAAMANASLTHSATSAQEQQQHQQQHQQEPVVGKAAGAPRRAGVGGVGGAAVSRQPSQQELQQQIEGYIARLDAASVNLLTKQDLVLLKKLGEGSFGTVYKADWGGAKVAVKCLNCNSLLEQPGDNLEAVMELLREGVLLATLHHPNILRCSAVVLPDSMLPAVTAAGGNVSSSSSHPAAAAQHPTPPAIVMDYVANGSLRKAIGSKATWLKGERAERAKVKVMHDTAVGLAYLHGRCIVHFDLKTDNILVNLTADMTPEIKIGDLGLVKVQQHSMLTGDFGMRGTLPYIAPELLTPDAARNATLAVDIYSFGVVMWEVWTLMNPLEVEHALALLKLRSEGKLGLPLPGTDDWEGAGESPDEPAEGWSALMHCCLEAAASSRPTSAELVTALKAMLDSLG